MKRKTNYIILLFLMTIGCQNHLETNISIMTYNVRYGLADDGENSWQHRKEHLVSLINSKKPDFLGTQEGLPFQVSYINESMPNYKFIGTDRDGNGKGENTAIFYNENKFENLEQQTFWLSTTPNVVSKDWDAAFPRICTYGLFRDKKTKLIFWVFNTHLDHVGIKARENSMRLILDKIKEINIENHPLFLMGDFNAEPESETIRGFKLQLEDSKDVSIEKPVGPKGTFNSFQFNIPVTTKIDYIFITKNINIKINNYEVISDSYDSKYPSDHLPIYIELTIK